MGSESFRNSRRFQARHIPTMYAYNPYSMEVPFQVVSSCKASKETLHREVAKKMLPAGTIRTDLYGRVPFHPFPDNVLDRTRVRTEAPSLDERPQSLVQLFFGQLPYKVSDNMIIWLCDVFAESDVLYIERVMQEKSRKGCMQVFVDEEAVNYITTGINKRILFDATGVWHAENELQLDILEEHCNNEANRFKGLPFGRVVVERSTSTYVRRRHAKPAVSSKESVRSTPPPAAIDNDSFSDAPIIECETNSLPPSYGDVEMCQCQQCMAPYCSYTAYPPSYYEPMQYDCALEPPMYHRY